MRSPNSVIAIALLFTVSCHSDYEEYQPSEIPPPIPSFPMKILIITNHFWPEDFKVNEMAFDLVEKGHDVTVMSGIPNYPKGKFFDGYGLFKRTTETHHGVKIHRMPLIPRLAGRSHHLIMNYLSSAISFCFFALFHGRKKFDVTFVFNTSPATVALPAILIKKIYGTPIVMWVLDLWPESISATSAIKTPWILRLVKTMMRSIYRQCDRILMASKGFESNIRGVGGYEGELTYFPNWTDLPEKSEEESNDLAKLPELPNGFKIVFTGNIGAAQDFETVLSAAEQLKEHDYIHWIIVGDGRMADWVKSEVDKRGIESHFQLVGRYPGHTMSYFLDQADVLLLTLSDRPIFALTVPRKLPAYMSGGKPILTSIQGEVAKIVNEADAGIACPAQDPTAMATAVMKLYDLPETLRSEMGERAKKYCEQHFDSHTIFLKLDQILTEVTGLPNQVDWETIEIENQKAIPLSVPQGTAD